MEKHQPIIVYWLDTVTDHNWLSEKGALMWGRKYENQESIGFFVEKNKSHLLIVCMKDGGDITEKYSELQKIPIGCITKIKKLYEKSAQPKLFQKSHKTPAVSKKT